MHPSPGAVRQSVKSHHCFQLGGSGSALECLDEESPTPPPPTYEPAEAWRWENHSRHSRKAVSWVCTGEGKLFSRMITYMLVRLIGNVELAICVSEMEECIVTSPPPPWGVPAGNKYANWKVTGTKASLLKLVTRFVYIRLHRAIISFYSVSKNPEKSQISLLSFLHLAFWGLEVCFLSGTCSLIEIEID